MLDLYGKSVRAGFEIVKKGLSLRSEIVLARFDCTTLVGTGNENTANVTGGATTLGSGLPFKQSILLAGNH